MNRKLRDETGYEKALRNPAGEFSRIKYALGELCQDVGASNQSPKPGLFGFAEKLISVAEDCLAKQHLPLVGVRPFGKNDSRPSSLFSDMGTISQMVQLLPSDALSHCDYQQDKRSGKPYVRKLYKLTLDLLRFLWRSFTSLYPGISFHRQFYYIEFAVTLFYEWEKYEGYEDDDFMWMWSEFAHSHMPDLSLAMRTYEDKLESLYSKSVKAAIEEIRSHCDFVIRPPTEDPFAVEEEILSTQKFSLEYPQKYAELCAVAIRYICFQYSREIASSSSIEQFFVPDAYMRRFLLCFHEAFCHLRISQAQSASALAGVYPAVLRVLDAINKRGLPADVAAAAQLSRSCCNSYFQFVGYTQTGGKPFLSEPATMTLKRLFAAFTELSLQIRAWEHGPQTLAHGVAALGSTWERLKSLDEPPPQPPPEEEHSHSTSRGIHTQECLNADTAELYALVQKIRDTQLDMRKDIKTIKGEQEARSPNDKRRGPTPRFPEMVDEAIALLEQWGNNGSGSEPKVSSAAQTIFNKWKNNKSKKNKRYDNLKSFTEIVRRSWKRKKPSIGC